MVPVILTPCGAGWEGAWVGAREVLWVKADKKPQGVRNKLKQLHPEAKKGERKKQQAKEASSELR